MLIENTVFGKINKEELSIQRVLEFKNKSKDNKNIIAFSGGKDSIVLYDICKRAGIDMIPTYSPTSVDPPELINFIRKEYPEVVILPYKKNKNGELMTMWTLIPYKSMPPTRINRYCCDYFKESTAGNKGDTVFVGVRWEESNKRKKLSMVGFWKKKIIVRPLIDWTEEDVWEYIHKYNLKYPSLYDNGWKRIGCIGCPLSSKNQLRELELYPKIKANYIRAFDKMVKKRKELGKHCTWENGYDVYKWWTGLIKKDKYSIDGQCSLFE
ncbi:phosphoadenosine phosphosulfate reductase family protein [Clostridium thermobutyricum]|uniref:phosphoadenosine phosphosulfate reductase family protein n=1 Tax=Clostridium thermobutyricum TaxID=29372 RepID=UPI001A9B9FDD|nr:phosphoadenosine phosphosulfate reductase family protein [Clostridium thermobutyricum]